MLSILLYTLLFVLVTPTITQPVLPPVPPVPENPLAGVIEALRSFAELAPTPTPTGLSASSYLETIRPIVMYFLNYQNTTTGRIIDPDPEVHQEEEYSTPCFAHAAATLVVSGGDSNLLTPAVLALSASLEELATKNCASASCDFFSIPVMRSYALLGPLVSSTTLATWTTALKNISLHTWELPGQNWELTSAAGEFDRIVKRGLATGTDLNWTFWESRIGRLTVVDGGFWGGDGAFNDNTGQPKVSPTAYDAFGSTYVAQLLFDGYGSSNYSNSGIYAPYLGPITERGVWTRAAYQSPLGEQPVGGRSNQHQFAEATLAAVAEIYARLSASNGDIKGACALKRAARLYHTSIRRWIRPDGAIQILKNNFLNYTQRFGFMTYSYFSNYNLLVASWLAMAHENAGDDTIPECASIADIGGVSFALEDVRQRKVFASASGGYIEIMTGADPDFDSSGFNRFHYDTCSMSESKLPCRLPSLLGPSQAPGLSGNFAMTSLLTYANSTYSNGLSLGLFWIFQDDPVGTIHSLANNTLQTITAVILSSSPTNSPSLVVFTVQYVLWTEGVLVEEDYSISGGSVNMTAHVSLPGQDVLWSLMRTAQKKRDGVYNFFSPPSNTRASLALEIGDRVDFDAALPLSTTVSTSRVLSRIGVSFPAFRFDGTTNYRFSPPDSINNEVIVSLPDSSERDPKDGSLAFRVVNIPSDRNLTWVYDDSLSSRYLSRNGLLTGVFASLEVESLTPSLSYQIEVIKWTQ